MPNHLITESSGNYIQGVGTVQVNGDRASITIDDRTFSDFAKDDIPEGVVSGEQYSIRLSADGSQIFSLRPNQGSFVVVFDKFAAQKDMPPQPKIQKGGPREFNGKKWEAKDKLVFTAVLKIASKRGRGMEVPFIMDYTFKQWENTEDTVIPMGSKRKNQVIDFLKLFGWDENEDVIPYSDNVLPFLEKLLRAKGKKVLVTVKNGYVTEISEFDPDLL